MAVDNVVGSAYRSNTCMGCGATLTEVLLRLGSTRCQTCRSYVDALPPRDVAAPAGAAPGRIARLVRRLRLASA